MDTNAFERVVAVLGKVGSSIDAAKTLDIAEMQLVFTQPAALALAPVIGAKAFTEAMTLRTQAAELLAELHDFVQWLSQSRDSFKLLSSEGSKWSRIHELSVQVQKEMDATVAQAQGGHTGAAAEAADRHAVKNRATQGSVVQGCASISEGLKLAAEADRVLFNGATAIILGPIMQALPAAHRAPSPMASLFGLNSRLKHVISLMTRMLNDLQQWRDSGGWHQKESEAAFTFSQLDLKAVAAGLAAMLGAHPLLSLQ